MDSSYFKENGLTLLFGFIIIVISLWLSFHLYKKTNWPARIKGLLIPPLLFLPTSIFSLFFGSNGWNNASNMGSGFGIFYIIILSIIGYFVGLIIDLTRKNK